MSRAFDAFLKVDAERSRTEVSGLAAAEMLPVDERQAPYQAPKFQGEPGELLQPLYEGREGEAPKLQPHTLEIDDKQRDELMKLIQQVFVMPGAAAPRTIVLAGTEPGNGCSWVSCRMADILASSVQSPVCIVDANLRSPGLHQFFGVENHNGLSDALESTEPIRNFLRPLGRPNLWLLSCGADATNRRSLLSSDRMRFLLSDLRQCFGYVLVDSPALSLGNEGVVLSRAAEGVILVLKANSSRRGAARKTIEDLQGAGVRILGAILNQRAFPIP
ncbi:MAG: CpsD/CapB family tyrosine-protein kinase, partial [Candidatus Sulfotelmatobacter sp.]